MLHHAVQHHIVQSIVDDAHNISLGCLYVRDYYRLFVEVLGNGDVAYSLAVGLISMGAS